MATLTETAYVARKIINIGAIVLVLIIILRVVILTGIGIKDRYFPPPPPPPTVAFGKLPFPNFQSSVATPSAAISYSLETPDGTLPVLPTTMKVFFMPKPGPSFGSFDKMRTTAGKMSFNSVPQKTGPTSWRFNDVENPLRTLDIDEISGNFRVVYNYASDVSLFNEKNFTSADSVVSSARGFFDGVGVLSSDIQAGTPSITYLKWDSGILLPATAISNADAISVTLNRADIEKTPVVSPDARQGLVSILFSPSNDSKKKVLEARYFYSQINLEQWATYPLVKSNDAFDKLKAGKGLIASLPSPAPASVTIRQVYVAYLDPYPPQTYIQPVLVFSDQKGFVAYVPIISTDWLE